MMSSHEFLAGVDYRPLVNAETLADALGVSAALVYRMARDKRIPCHRVGGNWRFDLDEVLAATRREAD